MLVVLFKNQFFLLNLSWQVSVLRRQPERAVVVAVTVVRVGQAALHQVINMVTVRDCRVAAIGPTATGALDWRASVGIRLADFDDMLIVVAFVREVQVSIVQVANVVAVLDAQVAAIWAVNVGMAGMGGMGHGGISF